MSKSRMLCCPCECDTGSFAIVLPTRHDPECETASETVKALFRTLSDKDATEPYQPSIPSPKSPPVPGSWINRIWGRKDVEDMDRDIVKGLNDVGIDTEEYFKRYGNKSNVLP